MKKKRLFLVLLLSFASLLSMFFFFKKNERGAGNQRDIKTVSIQEAKKATQASLVSFEQWRNPQIQEAYTFYDMEDTPSAYLFNVSDNYGKAGYITTSATTKLDPVVEISDSIETPIVKTLQLINQITQGTIYEQQDVKTKYMYLGGVEYYVKLEFREGGNTQTLYYSIQKEGAEEVDLEAIKVKQDMYENYFEEGAQQKWENLFTVDTKP